MKAALEKAIREANNPPVCPKCKSTHKRDLKFEAFFYECKKCKTRYS